MTRIGEHVILSEDTQLGSDVVIGNNVTVYPCVRLGDNCRIMDGAVLGRPPISVGTANRPVDSSPKHLIIGDHSIVGANTVLYAGTRIGSHVLIGDLASIREGCTIGDQAVVGRGVLMMYDTVIGERTRIIDGAIITGNMVVEADVFIGPGVRTVNDDDVYLKRFGLVPFEVAGPVIRRFALIGTSATLAAGVIIGQGAIVAPQAMVTQDIPAWMVAAGVPARIVRPVDPRARQQILAHFQVKDEQNP